MPAVKENNNNCSNESPATNPNISDETKIYQYDVLLGKGPVSHRNPGNVRFREIIRSRQVEYTNTNRRRLKDIIARQIVSSVTSKGGKFLKYDDDCDDIDLTNTRSTTGWVVVDDATAREKVKQALRDCTIRRRSLSVENDDPREKQSFQPEPSIKSDVPQVSLNHISSQRDNTTGQHDATRTINQSRLLHQLLSNNVENHRPSLFSSYNDSILRHRLETSNHGVNLTDLLNLVRRQINIPTQQMSLNSTFQHNMRSNEALYNQGRIGLANLVQYLQSRSTSSNLSNSHPIVNISVRRLGQFEPIQPRSNNQGHEYRLNPN
jgi:hypothetical protein